MPIHTVVGAADLSAQIKAAGPKLVVVNYSASWCGPCKAIAPEIERLSGQFPDVVFLKVMEGENKDLVVSNGAVPVSRLGCNARAAACEHMRLVACVVCDSAHLTAAPFGGRGVASPLTAVADGDLTWRAQASGASRRSNS